jgi:hypothetical protein
MTNVGGGAWTQGEGVAACGGGTDGDPVAKLVWQYAHRCVCCPGSSRAGALQLGQFMFLEETRLTPSL